MLMWTCPQQFVCVLEEHAQDKLLRVDLISMFLFVEFLNVHGQKPRSELEKREREYSPAAVGCNVNAAGNEPLHCHV